VVGQLELRSYPLKMLVAGAEYKASSEPETPFEATMLALEKISTIATTYRLDTVTDPLKLMLQEQFDVVLQIHDQNDPRTWELLTAETNPHKLPATRRLVELGWSSETLKGAAYFPDGKEGKENEIGEISSVYVTSVFT
jgi:hypothetical protein